MYIHSQLNYKELLNTHICPGTMWLDLGCGHTIVPEWIKGSVPFQKALIERCQLAVGYDPVDTRPHIAGMEKYVGKFEDLPYPDGSFDLVTANMVVEHVEDPQKFAADVRRILKQGGKFLIHTPNVDNPVIRGAAFLPGFVKRFAAHYTDGRDYDDIFKTHYRMNRRQDLALPGFALRELDFVKSPIFNQVPLFGGLERYVIHKGGDSPWMTRRRPVLIAVFEAV